MHQISYKKRLILKVSTSVDGLRLKVSLLGNEIGKSSAKINYNVLREYVTGLTNGSISATQFQTNINRLNVATQIEASSILKLNLEMQQGLITEQQYKTGLIQISASLMNASAQTEQLSIKTRLLQSSLKLIGGLVNGIFSMGVSLLISGAISAMTKVINKHKEMIETTKNEVTSHKENAEKINDVVKAYSEYKDKITYTTEEKESLIKIQEQLVETYGSEAESIDLVNGKYDEQIEKLNKIKTDNLASVRNSAQSNFNEVSKDYDISNFAKFVGGKFNQTSAGFADEVYNQLGNEYEQFLQDINNIENISVRENFRNAHLDSTQIYNQSEDIEDNIKAWEQLQNVLRNYGLETSTLFNNVNSSYEKISEKVNTYQESLKTLAQAEYDFYVSKNPFDETWNSEQVKKWEDNLLNQITDSRIQDELNSIIKNTVGKIAENEIEIVPFTYDKEKVQSAVDEANLIFSKVELDGETSKTTVFESLEAIEKAMETLGKDGLIDTDSYDELLSIYPELEKVFVDTGKGYVASLSDIQKAEEDYIQSNKNIVEQSKPVIQEQMMSLVSEIAKAEVEQRNALAGGYDNKTGINDANNRLNNLKIQYRELSGILSELNEKQNSLNRDTELAYIQGMTGEISNLSSSVETLSGAFSEINTTGTMTSDTILKLVESGYASAIVYDENTHAATLNKQTLEELTKAKILATKVELQSKLTTAQNTSEIKAQIVALDMLYNNWDNIYNSGIEEETEKESESDNTDYYKENAEAQISALKHEYEIGNIDATSYYNQLLDLNKYYYEGKEEYLEQYRDYEKEVYDGLADAQKERLEAEKEKIQDVNDEQEKALELIKAFNEAENAKNNKTIKSYSEESGFNYVTDTKDILEKNSKLNQLIADYKNRELDKSISDIDKMSFQALREAFQAPITIPTNDDIMKQAAINTMESINNINNNQNNNQKSTTINVGEIYTENATDFMEQLNEILRQGIADSIVGK